MTPTETFVAESRRICEAATAGPWYVAEKKGEKDWPRLEAVNPDDAAREKEATEYDWFEPDPLHVSDLDDCVAEGNKAFIAHARTALPHALDIIEQQAKRIAELEAKVNKWESKHREDMSYHGGDHSSKKGT